MKSLPLTYAHSLFSLAEDEGIFEEIYEELVGLLEIFRENPDYSALLDSPTLPVMQRMELIDDAFSQCMEYVVNFLKILCEKKCVHLFADCVKEYEKLYNNKLEIKEVTAVTAVPLNRDLTAKLTQKLEKEWGKKVKLTLKVDKEILGGIILRTENSQTDASVRARLDAVKAQIASDEF
jgi:F-type H+-transporting ATPase subunit delta